MNIIIIGFKGCGKTLIGKMLAKRLKREFHDIDLIIESIYLQETGENLRFREIYEKHGNEYFRNLEKKVLEKMQNLRNCVISLGGGTIFTDENIYKKLVDNITIYLHVESDILYERILKKGVPAFFDSSSPRVYFDGLYAERVPGYRKLADIIVNNSKSAEDTLNNIMGELDKRNVR